jgi:nonsense-mediated mRNA decay protein 3
VEIVPVCKDEVVCLPKKLAQSLGNMSQIALVQRVTQTIQMIDPTTLHRADITDKQFWKDQFCSVATTRQMIEFTVMDIEPVNPGDLRFDASIGNLSQRHILSEAWVVRSSELGISGDGDDMIHCRTHLGHLLNPGDLVMGYDLRNSNTNDAEFEKMKRSGANFPDVVLVKKVFGDHGTRQRRRKWKLKRLDGDVDDNASTTTGGNDLEDFMQDLEEDLAMREGVNIFVDKDKIQKLEQQQGGTEDSEDCPEISLAEMMEDLEICDDPMGDEED